MHTNDLALPFVVVALTTATCGSTEKPFDRMTAEEHRAAAAHENDLADENLERVSGADITPPETMPNGGVYGVVYAETEGAIPYTYSPYAYEYGGPDTYIAWPRVSDPSERFEDAARKHRDNALRHERAAAALEGRPSPQPLPPERTDDQLLDFTKPEVAHR